MLVIAEEKIPAESPKRLLNIGCGTGEFVSFMKNGGWDVAGLELSSQAASIAKEKGIEVYSLSLEDFTSSHQHLHATFSVITAINVLEHVPNPVEVLTALKDLLVHDGLIMLRVPNDFSQLQMDAQNHLQKQPWWVATPDHINYFDFQSLEALLGRVGFDVVYSQSDFPMELFLLMGEDYTGNPGIGRQCHNKRVQFEMAISTPLRRSLYREMASLGIGRDCLTVGRRKKQ